MATRELVLLDDVRVDEAFAVLQLAGARIRSFGRHQRITKTTIANYRQWQTERSNYVVVDSDLIVGLVTLRKERLDEWQEFAAIVPEVAKPVLMLRALVTHPDHCGSGVGAFAVREVTRNRERAVYLDCISEFLPGYYGSLGFEIVARQTREYADEDLPYEIVLMRKLIR